MGISTSTNLPEAVRKLSNEIEAIATALDALRYESTVMGDFSRRLVQWLTPLRAASSYAIRLAANVTSGPLINDPNLRNILTLAQSRVATNVDAMLDALRDKKRPQIEDMEDVHDRLRHAIYLQAVLAVDSDAKTLQFVNSIYYLFRLNACLVNMAVNLGGKGVATSAPNRDQTATGQGSTA